MGRQAGARRFGLPTTAVLGLIHLPYTRLDEWRGVLRQTENLPPVLQAIIALDAWNEILVLQHVPWLGRLLCASILRQAGIVIEKPGCLPSPTA
ncbi:hypothetical protein RvVAT039_pl09120 (plasmid) [Agrobacterium vitis]|uniref:5-deoxy-glucuronate isomerase n=1 Tax=Agrobacterium vitis TaxID=373 RepID=A0A2Z2Q3S1_AGRVI|nr:5-deoxy-glucuronate isomerase [Agrobacterium vitis]BCH68079.1 hypothetical protein RvVAT039_pl09120 [Agrobacterium vitis]